jgi:hypothetical protein
VCLGCLEVEEPREHQLRADQTEGRGRKRARRTEERGIDQGNPWQASTTKGKQERNEEEKMVVVKNVNMSSDKLHNIQDDSHHALHQL